MSNGSVGLPPPCNGSVPLPSINNTTGCGLRPPPRRRPPSSPPPPPCYTCSSNCILKVVELAYIIGVLANLFVVSRVVVDKKLRKPTFVAIACLALSDALFVSCDIALSINIVIHFLTVCPLDPPVIQGEIFGLVLGTCWFAANGHLTLLAVVRFLLIVYPLKAHVYLTIKKVLICSVCVWILGAIILSSILVGDKLQGRLDILSPDRTFIMWAVVYLFPFAITCILHIVKLRVVHKVTRNKGSKEIKRMATLILLILFCAFVFPLPRFIHDVLVRINSKFPNFELFHNIGTLLFYLNNTLNPFIYALVSPPFRRSLQGMFRCKRSHQTQRNVTNDVLQTTSTSEASQVNDSSVMDTPSENPNVKNSIALSATINSK